MEVLMVCIIIAITTLGAIIALINCRTWIDLPNAIGTKRSKISIVVVLSPANVVISTKSDQIY